MAMIKNTTIAIPYGNNFFQSIFLFIFFFICYYQSAKLQKNVHSTIPKCYYFRTFELSKFAYWLFYVDTSESRYPLSLCILWPNPTVKCKQTAPKKRGIIWYTLTVCIFLCNVHSVWYKELYRTHVIYAKWLILLNKISHFFIVFNLFIFQYGYEHQLQQLH